MANKKKVKEVWWCAKYPDGALLPFTASLWRWLAKRRLLHYRGIDSADFKKRGYRVVKIEVREI